MEETENALPPSESVASEACPICLTSEAMGLQAKSLYGFLVCKKCHSDFTRRRVIAYILDNLIYPLAIQALVVVLGLVLGLVAGALRNDAVKMIAGTGVGAIGFLLNMAWFLVRDAHNGQSLGKKIMGLHVIDEETGNPIDLKKSFKRNLPIYIPFVVFLAALKISGGKRHGDTWARTRVVWSQYQDRLPFNTGETGPYPPPKAPVLIVLLIMAPVFLFIFGFLAAIAIPNILRGREAAQKQQSGASQTLPAAVESKGVASSGESKAGLVLEGIAYDKADPSKSLMAIDGQLLKKGDPYEDYIIKDIQPDYVIFEDTEGKETRVPLFQPGDENKAGQAAKEELEKGMSELQKKLPFLKFSKESK